MTDASPPLPPVPPPDPVTPPIATPPGQRAGRPTGRQLLIFLGGGFMLALGGCILALATGGAGSSQSPAFYVFLVAFFVGLLMFCVGLLLAFIKLLIVIFRKP